METNNVRMYINDILAFEVPSVQFETSEFGTLITLQVVNVGMSPSMSELSKITFNLEEKDITAIPFTLNLTGINLKGEACKCTFENTTVINMVGADEKAGVLICKAPQTAPAEWSKI